MIPAIQDYFSKGCGRCDRYATPDCSTRQWAQGLQALRQICRDAGLVETLKWAHPCYGHACRNIAIIGAFRGDFRLSFFQADLLQDVAGLLEKPGPNTRHANMIRFTGNDQVAALAPTLRAYLQEAMGHASTGRKPPPAPAAPAADLPDVLPDVLADALAADAELAQAFQRLTPGRQRSHILHLNAAKKAETRVQRLARCRSLILAGKGGL